MPGALASWGMPQPGRPQRQSALQHALVKVEPRTRVRTLSARAREAAAPSAAEPPAAAPAQAPARAADAPRRSHKRKRLAAELPPRAAAPRSHKRPRRPVGWRLADVDADESWSDESTGTARHRPRALSALSSTLTSPPRTAAAKGLLTRAKAKWSVPASTRGRPLVPRDRDLEAADYLPRQACHFSLPPGEVACHLHKALRLSGTVLHDEGPAPSD